MKNTNTKSIAVLFGGCSSEHEISLSSAAAILRSIDRSRYTPVPVGITRDGRWFHFTGPVEAIENGTWENNGCVPAMISPDTSIHGLVEMGNASKIIPLDGAFPVLHGKNGEDGTVQGLLALAGIPCIGCGVLSSALCMDKDVAHQLAALAGIPVPGSVIIERIGNAAYFHELTAGLTYPLFVKPVCAGSSFGITKVEQKEQLSAAIVTAFAHDNRVIVEEYIEGFEVGCAVMGNDTLTVGAVDEIELSSGFFDYTEKYTLKTSKIHMPARISDETAERIKDTAKRLYRTLQCSGFARVDMFLTPEGRIVFNEINTIPGFTVHSRFPNMMKGIGMGFEETVNRIIEQEVG